MTPRRKRLGVIAGMWDPLDPIETTMTLIAVNISLLWTALVQEQVHTCVIASSFVMVLDGSQIWLTMKYKFMKSDQSMALNDFQEMHVNS